MVKPGFTDTVWEAIGPVQLVDQLTTGPGEAPMAAAATAYAALADQVEQAAAEYRAVLAVLDEAWSSQAATEGLSAMSALSGWLDQLMAAAGHNADIAGRQAAAYRTARTTLPDAVAVAQAVQYAHMLVPDALIGAPLAGLLDHSEQQVNTAHQQTARVMQAYETASDHLAQPWPHDLAPRIVDGAAFTAEPLAATLSGGPASAPLPNAAVASGLPGFDGPPVPPMASAPVAGAGPRAVTAAASTAAQGMEIDAGFATAPAVLGGISENGTGSKKWSH